ncbi:MAG: NADH-quinone oxidoreductase subunit J [Chloroherpetonaceae bacterium]|nr:NADH-quinone oxidoreductase subunit J [Chthonomonadaceae bacterium]MDW8207839.1 NADH-quinone oxidoreductase subunit J [Chloroherpetonaceae bacterium]
MLILFWILALTCVGASIAMVVTQNPVRSALYLVITFLCVAVFYVMLSAQFLAAVQIIVYAGAIMVLFLFVIMLLNLGAPQALRERGTLQPFFAAVLGTAFVVMLLLSNSLVALSKVRPAAPPEVYVPLGTVEGIGKNLFDPKQPWILPFEITSILLLVAIVGAVIMAKRRIQDHTP